MQQKLMDRTGLDELILGKSVLREGTSSRKAQRMSLGCLKNSRKARVAGTERTRKEQK